MESDEMLSHSAQAFNDKVATSPELQTKLRTITSPIDFLALAKAEGFDLDFSDLQAIAQEAFQQWLERLPPKTSEFFHTVRNDPTLDSQLKTCQSSSCTLTVIQLSRFYPRHPSLSMMPHLG
jgi:predicted ribosomally synthesized peptide with nif11-like leader